MLQVQLLTLIFMSLPGPYMMFIGGEEGIEEILTAVNTLKNDFGADWADLEVAWLNGDDVPQNVFGIARRNDSTTTVTLVNLGDQTERIALRDLETGALKAVRIHLSVGVAPFPQPISQPNSGGSIELSPRSGIIFEL
jgi:hypothetical protein